MANDDGIIRIGTSVDVSSLRAGMAQAQAAVKAATENMAAAQAAFGKAAAAGNTQAAEALQLYRTELASAQSAVAAMAGAESEETQALRSNISARMAASAELRVLEGNFMGSTRAASAFLSTLPGIGTAMQLAFPIFGAVALIEILGRATAAVGELITAYRNLDGAAIKASTDAIIAGEKIVSIKPSFDSNAVARIIAGAGLQQSTTVQNAQAKLKEIQYARELADAQAQVNEQGKTGAALQQQKIADIRKEIDFAQQAKAQADALVETYRQQLEAKTNIETDVVTKNRVVRSTQQINTITDPHQIEAIQQQLKTAVQASAEFNHQLDLMKVKLQGAQIKLPSVEVKGENQAAEKKFKGFETAFEQERAAQVQNVFAERAFWESKLSAFQVGSSEYLSVVSKVAEFSVQAYRTETEAVSKYQEQQKRDGEQAARSLEDLSRVTTEIQQKQAAEILRSSDAWDGYAAAITKGSEIQDQNKASIEEATISMRVATGQMTKLAAAHARAAIHAADYTAKLKALKAELDELRSNAKIDPITGQNTDAANAKSQQDVQNQIQQMQGQQAVSAISDQSAIQQQIAQPWLNAFNQINEGWLQVQNRMLFMTRNIGLEFAKMGQNLVIWGLDAAEKWALQWIEKELLTVVFHHTANAQKAASDTAANSTALAQGVATNVALSESYAAVAAAAAAASVAAIPVVGWAMAPGVAAATYAETSALAAMASFDTGTGYVPRDGLAMIHEGEAVIPAPTMEDLRGGGAGGGDINISQQNHFHGFNPDEEFRRQLHRNASHVADAVQRNLRQGGKV